MKHLVFIDDLATLDIDLGTSHLNTLDPVAKAVIDAAKENDLRVKRINRFALDRPPLRILWSRLKRADLVVAHIARNIPNLIYEIGLAHGLSVPVLMIARSGVSLPTDLIGQTLITYSDSEEGIQRLEFEVSARLQQIFSRKGRARGVWAPPEAKVIAESPSLYEGLSLRDNFFRKDDPSTQGKELVKWLAHLFKKIPGLEIIASEEAPARDLKYDFVLWNSTKDSELSLLGNPIVVETKVVKRLPEKVLKSICKAASHEGLRGLIVVTLARPTELNFTLVKNWFHKHNLFTILLYREDLQDINNAKDLVDSVKFRLRQIIYR